MKKRCIAIILVGAVAFSLHVSAEQTEAEIANSFSKIADEVANTSGSEVASGLSGENIENTADILLEFLTPEQVLDELFGMIKEALPSALSLLCMITGLVVLSAVCNSICSSLDTGGISNGFSFLSTSVIIAGVLTSVIGQFDRITDFFEGISSLMNGMIPITGAVWAMGGNVGSASLGTATLYAMLGATEWLCSKTLLPVCYIMGIAAICSGLSGGGVLDGFVSGVKRVYGFFIGVIMTVFVFVLGTQTTVSAAADTVAARSAKLISATIIPGVGGAVGETLRTVAGSVEYIKSVVGVGGIVLIVVLTLPTLIALLLTRTVFLLTSTLSDTLGCKREARLLSELSGIYGFVLGAVAVCSVAFIIALSLFVRCAVALD
ncbi:MAG: hypothetical protein J6U86_03050 [Clostridia bacterium]|nr:hypothetical protein [Clostridia bacterium]